MTEFGMFEALFSEILRDTHAYGPGVEPNRPTIAGAATPRWAHRTRLVRERLRDVVERTAGGVGFSRSHFDPATGGRELARLAELRSGLEETYSRLADEPSRRALLDLLKFRVLGAPHARLSITPEEFRGKQAWLDEECRIASDTFVVSDPWFSPLSRYRVTTSDGTRVDLHAHSVDLVSVYMLGQYTYRSSSHHVSAGYGDVVLDIGGCWGDTALYFADLVGPNGKVFTFEFDPESLAILRANLALNPRLASRIEIVEKALWKESGTILPFARAGRCTSVASDDTRLDVFEAETVTVDDFVRDAGIARVGLVKMDVEGAERPVVLGSMKCLREHQPKLAIAAYHKDDDLIELPRLIDDSEVDYQFFLASYSPVEEETVLFAAATDCSSAT